MTNKINLNGCFLVVILTALTVSPAFVLGDGARNLLLIGLMAFSPFILLRHLSISFNDILLFVFIALIVFCPWVNHPETMRWATVIYSIMFCLTYMAVMRLVEYNSFSEEDYCKFLRFVLFAYFFVLLLQQFCVLFGLPIVNVSNYDPQEPWKLNSLTSEPAHAARVMALLSYCYITVKEIIFKRKYSFKNDFTEDKWIWVALLWSMLTMGSASAFLFLPIVLLKFISFKSFIPFVVVGLLFLSLFQSNHALSRVVKTTSAVIALDEKKIIKADHSASVRIVPTIICFKMIDFSNKNTWFGYGVDYVQTFMYKKFPGVKKGFSGGGLIAFLLEYGILSFFVFLFFSVKAAVVRKDIISFIFWFFLVFMLGINNQFVWATITLLSINKYFLNKSKEA